MKRHGAVYKYGIILGLVIFSDFLLVWPVRQVSNMNTLLMLIYRLALLMHCTTGYIAI